jgi:hypothetical protein
LDAKFVETTDFEADLTLAFGLGTASPPPPAWAGGDAATGATGGAFAGTPWAAGGTLDAAGCAAAVSAAGIELLELAGGAPMTLGAAAPELDALDLPGDLPPPAAKPARRLPEADCTFDDIETTEPPFLLALGFGFAGGPSALGNADESPSALGPSSSGVPPPDSGTATLGGTPMAPACCISAS